MIIDVVHYTVLVGALFVSSCILVRQFVTQELAGPRLTRVRPRNARDAARNTGGVGTRAALHARSESNGLCDGSRRSSPYRALAHGSTRAEAQSVDLRYRTPAA